MISPISSRVTPLFSARSRWPGSWSVRYMAISAATVMKLRSRLESPGRSQTSPKSTFSLRSMSFGATPRTTSRAVDVTGCVLTVGSFHGFRGDVDDNPGLYALRTFDASRVGCYHPDHRSDTL